MLAGLGSVGRVGRHGLGGGTGAASASKRPNYSVDLTQGQLGKDMTLARASVGTYYDSAGVLRTAGVNVPRFDYDPVTLAPRGLLLEDASTNLFKDSTTGGTTWAIAAVTNTPPVKTANNVIAPDGTMTGTRLVYPAVSAAGSASNIQQSPTMIAAPYTMSVWLRGDVGGETTYICTTPDGVTYFRQQYVLTTTWQRFVLTTGNLTAAVWFWIIGTDRRDTQQAATPAQTIYTWGAQLEQSDHATSYIATTAAAVTRAIDNCVITPTNMPSWIDLSGAGTWFAEFDYLDATPINGARIIGTNGSPTGPTPMQILSGRNIGQYDGAVSMNSPTVTAVNEVTRAITSWQVGQTKVCANGGVVATSALLTGSYVFFGFAGVGLMSVGGGNSCEGHLRVLKYWKRILSDTEMQSITALGDPSLSLDFMTPGVLDSRITFTRASTATYFDSSGVMRTAAVNAPRWDYDPSTRVLNGLLIEDARTNLVTSSIPTTGWSLGNVTITAASGVAPDGTNTMVKIADTITNSFHCITGSSTITASQQYTFSAYLKMGEIRYVNVEIDNGAAILVSAVFDLQTGVISGNIVGSGGGTAGSAQMQSCSNGVYRCSVSGILSTATLLRAAIIHMPGPTGVGYPPYLGVVGQGTFVWGLQVEAGTFPTSHIPTTSGVVTRAIDNASMPTASWFNPAVSSMLLEYLLQNVPDTTGNTKEGLVLSDGTANNRLALHAESSLTQSAYFYSAVGGTSVVSTALGNLTANAPARLVGMWNGSAPRGVLNGGAPITYAQGMPAGIRLLTFGNQPGGLFPLNGHIRKVQYWPRTLTDAEMQAKTLADVSTPSLVLDFMQPGVLDPSLVMSRPSVATYFDVSGTLQTMPNDQTRWDYDPTTGALRGVLIENTRTNSIRNSSDMSATVPGTPGSGPTNWSYNGGSAGLSFQTVGTGTENGIPYVDIRWFGTAAAGVNILIADSSLAIPALTGQVWAASIYWRVTAGNTVNMASSQVIIREYTSAGMIIVDHPVTVTNPLNAPLVGQRPGMAFTLNGGATTAFVQARYVNTFTAGAVDVTIRYAAPQLEQGIFASSIIPTRTGAVTRAADDMYMPLGPWFSTTNSSLFAEYLYARSADAQFAHNPVGIGDGQNGANNKFVIRAAGVNNNVRSMFSKRAGVAAGVNAPGSAALFAPNKVAASWDASVGMITAAGLAPGVGGSQMPLNLIQLVVGDQDRGTGETLDGCIRKIMYWNKTLNATELQSVTT